MEASAQRLYEAAKMLRRVVGQTNVARLLNESPQTVKNWESRGVSDAGAIKAEGVIGCRAYWLATGEGEMLDSPTPSTQPAPAVLDLAAALPVVLDALGELTAGQWRMVRARLDHMPVHPEMRDDVASDVLPVLQAAATKHRRAA